MLIVPIYCLSLNLAFASSRSWASRANAAPEWQAGSLRWRSRKQMEACPFEGLVGRNY
jgi:hypothetical protein